MKKIKFIETKNIFYLYHMIEITAASCSRFLRRIFNVRSRETNEYVYDRHIEPFVQITEERPRQIGLYLDLVVLIFDLINVVRKCTATF